VRACVCVSKGSLLLPPERLIQLAGDANVYFRNRLFNSLPSPTAHKRCHHCQHWLCQLVNYLLARSHSETCVTHGLTCN